MASASGDRPRRLFSERRGLYGAGVLLVVVAVLLVLLLTRGSGSASSGAVTPPATPQEHKEEAAREAAQHKRDVTSLERAVLDDARTLAKAGVVRGPVLSAHCTLLAEGSSSALSPHGEGSYVCLAVNSDRHVQHHGHIVEGVRFYGRIDYVHSGVFKFGGSPPGPPFVYGT